MSYLKETIDYKGMSIKIYYDENADFPAEWDNPEYFLCSDYRDLNVDSESISASECREAIEQGKWFLNGFYIFPVSIYDHSSLTLHLGNLRGWDYSNGYAFVCVKRTKGWTYAKSQAEKVACIVLDEWNMYLSGEVYGFIAEDEDGSYLDSCWGFYGDEGLEEAVSQAQGIIDYELHERHEAELKAMRNDLAPLYARTAFAY